MEASEPPAAPTESIPLITKIRNMWEFASVMQFIHVFGKAVRIDDDFDIQVCIYIHCLRRIACGTFQVR